MAVEEEEEEEDSFFDRCAVARKRGGQLLGKGTESAAHPLLILSLSLRG